MTTARIFRPAGEAQYPAGRAQTAPWSKHPALAAHAGGVRVSEWTSAAKPSAKPAIVAVMIDSRRTMRHSSRKVTAEPCAAKLNPG
jgi:hypothetical protein